MDDEKFDADQAIKILGHPIRIRIIDLLATRGPLSWKELSKELGTSTGSLYHHIDMLERLVDQDSSKKYVLTKLGFSVHAHLMEHSSPRDPAKLGRVLRQKSAASIIQDFLFPRSLVQFLTSSAVPSLGTLAGVSAVVLLLVALSRSEVLLLSFSPSQSLLLSTVSFGVSLLTLAVIGYVGTRLLHAKSDILALLVGSSVAFLPLAAFSLVLHTLVSAGSLGVLSDRNILTFAFALLQGWSACIMSAGVSVASGLRIEKALPISLALLYMTILIMFVEGLRFI